MTLSTARITPNTRRPLSHKPKKCPYCGQKFDPTYANSPTCSSDECRLARKYDVHRQRKAEQRGPGVKAICEICGGSYISTGKHRRTCGSANCQAELARNYQNAYDKQRAVQPKPRKFAVCNVCGKSFIQLRRTSVICSDECRAEKSRRYATQHYHDRKVGKPRAMFIRTCSVCGKEFSTYFQVQKTCGRPACKTDHHRQTHREWLKKRDQPDYQPKRMTKNGLARDKGKELRQCLKCDKMFMSWGPQNRRCPKCETALRAGDEY